MGFEAHKLVAEDTEPLIWCSWIWACRTSWVRGYPAYQGYCWRGAITDYCPDGHLCSRPPACGGSRYGWFLGKPVVSEDLRKALVSYLTTVSEKLGSVMT